MDNNGMHDDSPGGYGFQACWTLALLEAALVLFPTLLSLWRLVHPQL